MDLNIKNRVCSRCVMVVSDIFRNAGIDDAVVQLGKVRVQQDIPVEKF